MLQTSGYILAGGRSSRMGRDKALLSLAGRPLIEHAVTKLRSICADVRILSADSALAAFAPIVPDSHSNCGPIGGIEAALTHITRDWNLFLPVDTPFLPAALLTQWTHDVLDIANPPAPSIHIFATDDRPQPGVALIHRAVRSLITRAIQRNELSLLAAFEAAGREAHCDFIQSQPPWDTLAAVLPPAQLAARHLWFHNLNTPEDMALAEANLAALDT